MRSNAWPRPRYRRVAPRLPEADQCDTQAQIDAPSSCCGAAGAGQLSTSARPLVGLQLAGGEGPGGQGRRRAEPPQPDRGERQKGCVVLIDEIDKAESDVPNGLLEALGAGRFTPGRPRQARGRHRARRRW